MAEKNAHDSGFKMEPLYWVLLAVPLAVILKIAHADGLWIFLISGVAIIPLAGLMGKATEYLAETMGAGIGGLLNATFGNAAELIIALIAMWKALENPELLDLVRASITGSIVGNILLVLGLAILLGGLKQKRQTFNRTAASMGATLLAIAAAGLLLPTLYYHLPPEGGGKVTTLSEEIAVLLMVTYLLSLIFSLKTHSHLFAGPEASADQVKHEPEWSRRTSIIVLVCATIGVAWMSELLIGSVEHASKSIGMSNVFIGVIVVAVVGNAAEHSTAILVAMKDKMDLALNIAVGSSIQIALFVAPLLVFASLLMGHPTTFDLHFSIMEMIVIIVSVIVLAFVCNDGETHWMEGVMLLALYIMIAMTFFHLPKPTS